MTMAGRIGLMHQGRLVQVGTPAEIYEAPRTRWVAEFIGEVNLFDGAVVACERGLADIDHPAGRLVVRSDTARAGDKACLALRPEKIAIARVAPSQAGPNAMAGVVADIAYLGDLSVYKVRLPSGMLVKTSVANTDRRASGLLHRGETAYLSFSPDAGILVGE